MIIQFKFHANHCLVKSQDTQEVLLQGKVGADGLYVFPSLQLHPPGSPLSSCFVTSLSNNVVNESVSSIVNTPSSQYKWHLRLGHPNANVMRFVFQHYKIPYSIKNDSFCSACCIGKAHRLHAPSSTTVYNSPLVYNDLWGPAPIPSSNNFLYYVTFVDAYSRLHGFISLKKI